LALLPALLLAWCASAAAQTTPPAPPSPVPAAAPEPAAPLAASTPSPALDDAARASSTRRLIQDEFRNVGHHEACLTKTDGTRQYGRVLARDADTFTMKVTRGPLKDRKMTIAYTDVAVINRTSHEKRDAVKVVLVIAGLSTAAALYPVAAVVIAAGCLGVLILAMAAG